MGQSKETWGTHKTKQKSKENIVNVCTGCGEHIKRPTPTKLRQHKCNKVLTPEELEKMLEKD